MAIQVVKALNPLGFGGIEIWLPIKGFETYHISNIGRVKSFYLSTNGFYLNYQMTKAGYYKVQLYKSGKRFFRNIHRLVAETFIKNSNPEILKLVNHKDCNKTNNSILNLEWCNRLQNAQHAKANGRYLNTSGDNHWTRKNPLSRKTGDKNGRAKLSWNDIFFIRKNRDKYKVNFLAKKFLVSKTSIRLILKGITWRQLE